jgi:hypothetical protein
VPHPAGKEEPIRNLTVLWCDRCGRSINRNDEREHFHIEQSLHCVKYRKIDTDWGWCKSRESVYGGRIMFEHDTCSKWPRGSETGDLRQPLSRSQIVILDDAAA